MVFLEPEVGPGKDLAQGEHGNNPKYNNNKNMRKESSSPWVSFYLTFLPDRILSFLSEVFYSCPQVLAPPGCCRGKEVSLLLL